MESGSWALKSGVQLKESRIPRTSGIRNPNSSDKDPESPLHFPRRGIVLDSLTCLRQAMRSRLLCEEIRLGYITISVRGIWYAPLWTSSKRMIRDVKILINSLTTFFLLRRFYSLLLTITNEITPNHLAKKCILMFLKRLVPSTRMINTHLSFLLIYPFFGAKI